MKKLLPAAVAALCLLVTGFGACHRMEQPDSPGIDPPRQNPNTLLDTTPMQEISYYQNPVMTATTEQAWENYGFGDPFVMRYGGRYYLYVSTKDGQVGVKCWTSDDLVHWSYAGLCATDQRTRGAYAPEVYYYNGYFYMYTSPAGNGHYVLRSASPTGEFEVITENLGMSIDGSVFIDRDGDWYFYTANHGQMMVYDMTSPTTMKRGRTLGSISVNGGWTEGPMTVYHDGYYYMTYTGNHVLSRAYRINYGVSATSPLKFDRLDVQNPLLLHTMGDLFGIGHSSTVKGPDLDSYYIVYHSLNDPTPNRSMHVDRIAFNGTEMQILGPADGPQQVPDMPDVYHRFEEGASLVGWRLEGSFGTQGTGLPLAADSKIVSEYILEGDFTAEYHVSFIGEGAQAGALFAYSDDKNFGACYFDPAAQDLCIEITKDGHTQIERTALPRSFGQKVRFDCMQSLQIERRGNTYTFYFGDRPVYELTSDALSDGGIGYVTRGGSAAFGYIGGTAAVGGRGAANEYHSIGSESGLIPAEHYTLGSFATEQIEGVYATSAPESSMLNYRVLAQHSAGYGLSVRYATRDGQDARIKIYLDGNAVQEMTLTGGETLHTAVLRKLQMDKGQHTLSLEVTQGGLLLVELEMQVNARVPKQTWTPEQLEGDYAYSDGSWRVTSALSTSHTPISAKRLFGSESWGDYAATVSVTPKDGVNCGILVRATNPGAPNFMHQPCSTEDAEGGTDWLQGYFVGIAPDGVVLGKQNYGYRELARASGTYAVDGTYTLRVECLGATLRVFVDGELCLEYTDPRPFLQGMIGVRTHKCAAAFENLTIEPISG